MTELKTLKDLEWFQDDINKPIVKVDVEELRQEEIKWIKDFRENKLWSLPFPMARKEIVDWIKHFFNITEEELKDGDSL